MKLKKGLQNYILVAMLGIASVAEAVSGFVLWFALPHAGGGGGRFGGGALQQFWSLSRTSWTSMHDWAAIALVVIALAHITMHRKWIWRMTLQVIRQARASREEASVAISAQTDRP